MFKRLFQLVDTNTRVEKRFNRESLKYVGGQMVKIKSIGIIKKGDKVFINDIEGGQIRRYFHAEDIPKELISVEGSLSVHERYHTEGAIVVGRHEQYYLVKYLDISNREVTLGFLKEQLKLM